MKKKSLLILVDMWQTAAGALAQIVKDQRLSMKDTDMHGDAAMDRLKDEAFEKGREAGKQNLGDIIKTKDHWHRIACDRLNAIDVELKETYEKLHICGQAMQDLEYKNDKLDTYWNELHEKDQATIASLTEENAKLRAEEEDTIAVIVDLRNQLQAALVWKERYMMHVSPSQPLCRHKAGTGQPCDCPVGKCKIEHEELPF